MFKIEKNIAIPKKKWHYSKFPFKDMEVGDSFFVRNEDIDSKYIYTTRQRIYNSYRKFLQNEEQNITIRIVSDRENGGVRIFRVK